MSSYVHSYLNAIKIYVSGMKRCCLPREYVAAIKSGVIKMGTIEEVTFFKDKRQYGVAVILVYWEGQAKR